MIGAVDETIATLDVKKTIREIHPEICFWALNNQRPMTYGKKTYEGVAERLAVLQAFEPRTREILAAVQKEYRAKVAADDILDALAAAVTARLGTQVGPLQTLPARIGGIPVEVDRSVPDGGLPMEMVYYNPPHA